MLNLPRLIAHRGDKRYAPENTLVAFRQARAKGAAWVEFDATLTRNAADPVVIFHDDTVGRTTNLPDKLLTDTTFTELRAADAGSWFSPAFTGEQVPTLVEVIRLCDELGLAMNIEIKISSNGIADSPEPFDRELAQITARRVIEDVQSVRGNNWSNILLSSFSTEALMVAQLLAPAAPRGFLLHQLWPEDVLDEHWPEYTHRLKMVQPQTLNFNHFLIPNHARLSWILAMADRALGRRLPVLAYTVNDVAHARALLAWGVTALFTDAIGDLAHALDSADEFGNSGDPDSTGAGG